MNRKEFISTIPGKTQQEKAAVLGIKQAALCRWKDRPTLDTREALLLRGWSLLSEEQRREAMKKTNNPGEKF